jgi:hypothetical protein
MKQHAKAKKRFPRLLALGILLSLALLTVGVVAGVSKQRFKAQASVGQEGSTPMDHVAKAQSLAGQTADGQIKPLTAAEAQKLAAALKELANQSTEGLKQVTHADGTVSMDLQGRFQNVAVAKRNEDGSVSQSCIDNPAAGANFFGIDPKLVGVKSASGGAAVSSTKAAQK